MLNLGVKIQYIYQEYHYLLANNPRCCGNEIEVLMPSAVRMPIRWEQCILRVLSRSNPLFHIPYPYYGNNFLLCYPQVTWVRIVLSRTRMKIRNLCQGHEKRSKFNNTKKLMKYWVVKTCMCVFASSDTMCIKITESLLCSSRKSLHRLSLVRYIMKKICSQW